VLLSAYLAINALNVEGEAANRGAATGHEDTTTTVDRRVTMLGGVAMNADTLSGIRRLSSTERICPAGAMPVADNLEVTSDA